MFRTESRPAALDLRVTANNFSEVKKELRDSSNPLFSVEAMAVSIADKTQRRAKKGMPFHCYTLDCNDKTNELDEFLIALQENKDKFPADTRFQIVYRSKAHWSVADVKIQEGKIEFFLLDGANDLKTITNAITSIHDRCPEAIIRYSGGGLQIDNTSCATIALDHAYRLAKIPALHEELSQLEHQGPIGRYTSYGDYLEDIVSQCGLAKNLDKTKLSSAISVLRYISTSKFPSELGPLLRNAQLLSTVTGFAGKDLRGNDNESLKDYVLKRNHPADDDGIRAPELIETTLLNDKRKNIKDKALLFTSGLDEKAYEEILTKRKGSDNPLLVPSTSALSQAQQTKSESSMSISFASDEAKHADKTSSVSSFILYPNIPLTSSTNLFSERSQPSKKSEEKKVNFYIPVFYIKETFDQYQGDKSKIKAFLLTQIGFPIGAKHKADLSNHVNPGLRSTPVGATLECAILTMKVDPTDLKKQSQFQSWPHAYSYIGADELTNNLATVILVDRKKSYDFSIPESGPKVATYTF